MKGNTINKIKVVIRCIDGVQSDRMEEEFHDFTERKGVAENLNEQETEFTFQGKDQFGSIVRWLTGTLILNEITGFNIDVSE